MDPARIREYHIHIYYDATLGPDAARTLRDAIAARFEVEIGMWREEAGGPHPTPMFQVNFVLGRFAEIVPWLMLNRGGLSVLVSSRDRRRGGRPRRPRALARRSDAHRLRGGGGLHGTPPSARARGGAFTLSAARQASGTPG